MALAAGTVTAAGTASDHASAAAGARAPHTAQASRSPMLMRLQAVQEKEGRPGSRDGQVGAAAVARAMWHYGIAMCPPVDGRQLPGCTYRRSTTWA